MRRLHILGGGALGSLYASHFARTGLSDVTLLLRPEVAQRAGSVCDVRVTQEGFTARINKQQLRCEPSDGKGDGLDVLVVAVKAYDVRAALEGVRARMSDETSVILLCNGALAVADELEPHGGPLLVATSTHGAWSRGPRDIHHAGDGETWVGPLGRIVEVRGPQSPTMKTTPSQSPPRRRLEVPGNERASDAAQQFFATHGLGAHVEGPLQTEQRLWLKLAANAVLNPLTALWDCCNGDVLARAEGVEAAEAVCAEIARLSHHMASSDLQLDAPALVNFVHECAAANAANFSSMCMDVRHGRRTEIEQLNGWIARKMEEHGVRGDLGAGRNAQLAEAVRRRQPHGQPPTSS